MDTLKTADAGMMIRKNVQEVFSAFIDPSITTRFWFTHSSGPLAEGNDVRWKWEMYNVEVPVHVQRIVANKEILISWGEGDQLSQVLWKFTSIDDITYVHISNFDFQTTGDALTRQIADSVGGFTMVLAGLKALLEHDIELNLIGDKWPKEMQ